MRTTHAGRAPQTVAGFRFLNHACHGRDTHGRTRQTGTECANGCCADRRWDHPQTPRPRICRSHASTRAKVAGPLACDGYAGGVPRRIRRDTSVRAVAASALRLARRLRRWISRSIASSDMNSPDVGAVAVRPTCLALTPSAISSPLPCRDLLLRHGRRAGCVDELGPDQVPVVWKKRSASPPRTWGGLKTRRDCLQAAKRYSRSPPAGHAGRLDVAHPCNRESSAKKVDDFGVLMLVHWPIIGAPNMTRQGVPNVFDVRLTEQ